MNDVKCCVCFQEPEYPNTYYFETKGAKVFKCICQSCKEKTHDKWIDRGWKLVDATI